MAYNAMTSYGNAMVVDGHAMAGQEKVEQRRSVGNVQEPSMRPSKCLDDVLRKPTISLCLPLYSSSAEFLSQESIAEGVVSCALCCIIVQAIS